MQFFLKSRDEQYPLKMGINIVGRQKTADIQLKDPYVSRRHLSIDMLPDGSFTLMDLGSRNGLVIFGKKVASAVVQTGEAFMLGATDLVIKEE
jgi:pSer/pThr/pTyr-binding forkhead associated (FHA) protein